MLIPGPPASHTRGLPRRPRLAADGPQRPGETPPSPRRRGPARGAGDTRGNGTETARPPREDGEAARARRRRRASNPQRTWAGALKRPSPGEQGGAPMRAARAARRVRLVGCGRRYRRRVIAGAPGGAPPGKGSPPLHIRKQLEGLLGLLLGERAHDYGVGACLH